MIEMKIWRGQEYNNRGEKQLAGYLDDYHVNKGYMVSFNFNRKIFLREHDGQCRYSIPLDCMVCVYIVRGVLVFYAGGRESVDNSRDFALKNKSPCSACEFQAKQGISILGIKLLFFSV